MSWKLIALSEPVEGQTIVIDRDMLIGRHQQADIVLQAAHVSRRHAALLVKEDGSLWIQDLDSSNGTFVNDQQITEQQLKDQDEIHFENIRFQVLEDANDTVASNTVVENTLPGDEGMPTLEERSADVQVNRDGMPTNIGVPKPAPILEDVDVTVKTEPEPVAIPEAPSRVKEAEEQQKNTKVGLISFVVLIILIILAAIFFAGN